MSKGKPPKLKEPVKLMNIIDKMPAFCQKMFVGTVKSGRWAQQVQFHGVGDVDFINMKRDMTRDDLLEHFIQKPIAENNRIRGSLGMYGSFPDKSTQKAKWFCMDVDDADRVEIIRNKFVPILQAHDIEYIWEYGGRNMDRCHLWFFCDTNLNILTTFVEVLLKQADLDWRKLKLELYPTHKPTNIIRLMGGYHIRAGYANPIEFRGVLGDGPEFIVDSVIACVPVSQAYMVEVIAANVPEEAGIDRDPDGPLANWRHGSKVKKDNRAYSPNQFQYIPREDLKEPFKNMPAFPKVLSTQCQAIHQVFKKIKNLEYLEERGDDVHRAGLYCKGILDYQVHKIAKSQEDRDHSEEFKEWFFDEHRVRDWYAHQWHREPDESTLKKIVPSCKTWKRDFNMCGGCPFEDASGFSNPKQLYYGDKVKVQKVKEIKHFTNEEVRATTFKKVKALVNKAILKDRFALDLVIVTAQGTGKSTLVDSMIAHLKGGSIAKRKPRLKVLLAVPNGYLALDHRDRLKSHGIDAHMLLSFNNTFKYLKPDFGECPNGEEITEKLKIGVRSSTIKRSYCNSCEYKEECPFPTQYVKLKEMSRHVDVVICQHAHFRSPEATRMLRMVNFDVMFIDETFIHNLQTYIKATPEEKALLKEKFSDIPWIDKSLLPWLKGKNVKLRDKSVPKPTESQLKKMASTFDYYAQPYNMPDYLKLVDQDKKYDTVKGLYKFHPLPDVPMRIMTDATAPLSMVKTVLNNQDLKVVGRGQIINVKHYNPDNKIIKVIDGSNSKSSQADPARMEKILHFIGLKGISEYKNLTILVTVYKSDVEAVTQFFKTRYPAMMSRLTVSHMAIGTNAYKDTNVQFLLCGIHLNSLQLAFAEWEFINIENYWNAQNDIPDVTNNYPRFVKALSGGLSKRIPVQMKLLIGDKAYRVKFPELQDTVPLDEKQAQVHMMSLGATQQAMRLRFHDDKLKIVWDWSRRYRPGILFTDIVLENQLFGPVEKLMGIDED